MHTDHIITLFINSIINTVIRYSEASTVRTYKIVLISENRIIENVHKSLGYITVYEYTPEIP